MCKRNWDNSAMSGSNCNIINIVSTSNPVWDCPGRRPNRAGTPVVKTPTIPKRFGHPISKHSKPHVPGPPVVHVDQIVPRPANCAYLRITVLVSPQLWSWHVMTWWLPRFICQGRARGKAIVMSKKADSSLYNEVANFTTVPGNFAWANLDRALAAEQHL